MLNYNQRVNMLASNGFSEVRQSRKNSLANVFIISIICLMICLQVLDVATTLYALKTGTGHEINPVGIFFISVGGYFGAVALKVIVVPAICAFWVKFYYWSIRIKWQALTAFYAICFVFTILAYVYVVMHNAAVIGWI